MNSDIDLGSGITHVYENLSIPTTFKYINRVRPISRLREGSPIRKQAMQPQQEYILFGNTGICVLGVFSSALTWRLFQTPVPNPLHYCFSFYEKRKLGGASPL